MQFFLNLAENNAPACIFDLLVLKVRIQCTLHKVFLTLALGYLPTILFISLCIFFIFFYSDDKVLCLGWVNSCFFAHVSRAVLVSNHCGLIEASPVLPIDHVYAGVIDTNLWPAIH